MNNTVAQVVVAVAFAGMVMLAEYAGHKRGLAESYNLLSRDLLTEKIAVNCVPKLGEWKHIGWSQGWLVVKRYEKRLHQMPLVERIEVAQYEDVKHVYGEMK